MPCTRRAQANLRGADFKLLSHIARARAQGKAAGVELKLHLFIVQLQHFKFSRPRQTQYRGAYAQLGPAICASGDAVTAGDRPISRSA